jgi:hypothetical protein
VKRVTLSILQFVGYLLLFLVVSVVLMGLTKMFIGDWESEGPPGLSSVRGRTVHRRARHPWRDVRCRGPGRSLWRRVRP